MLYYMLSLRIMSKSHFQSWITWFILSRSINNILNDSLECFGMFVFATVFSQIIKNVVVSFVNLNLADSVKYERSFTTFRDSLFRRVGDFTSSSTIWTSGRDCLMDNRVQRVRGSKSPRDTGDTGMRDTRRRDWGRRKNWGPSFLLFHRVSPVLAHSESHIRAHVFREP